MPRMELLHWLDRLSSSTKMTLRRLIWRRRPDRSGAGSDSGSDSGPDPDAERAERRRRRRRQLASISEILSDRLYLSGVGGLKPDLLQQLGITAVVRVATEDEERAYPSHAAAVVSSSNLSIFRVRLPDDESAEIGKHFEPVSEFIDDQLTNGGRVLVHCGVGVSRSATLILAYLMRHRGFELRRAFNLLRAARPPVRPNNGFFRQLIDYEKSINNGHCTARMIIDTRGRPTPDLLFAMATSGGGQSIA